MANFKLLTLALALASSSAFAGYAQLAPPVGWSQGGSAASTFNFAKVAANDATFTFNTVRTTASLNVGGRAVTMPATMRFAANAGRFAATAAFGSPLLFAGLTAGAIAYKYYTDNNIEVKDGVWQKKTKSDGAVCTVDCKEYRFTLGGKLGSWSATPSAAFSSAFVYLVPGKIGDYTVSYNNKGCVGTVCSYSITSQYKDAQPVTDLPRSYNPEVRSIPPYNTSETRYDKLTKEQFEDEMAPKPVPDHVPEHFPVPVEWPVEPPIVNPSPGPSPQPQPLRVPQGDPQPIPGTDPRQWRSPAIDIVPSPTANDPWRIDVQPKDIIKTDPTPLPETAPVPVPTPDAPGDATAPPTEQTDFCKANPEVLACAKPELDTPEEDQTPTKNKDISISPAGGFGSGGSCPSGKTLKAAGIQLSYQPVCDFMSAMRPVVIALAWLGAGLILLGLRGQTS